MIPLLQQSSQLPGGYGLALLQTLLALAAVCILAWVALRWSAKRGLGAGRGRVRVLERVALEGRRSLYLVEVAGRVLLLGAGDSGAPSVLAELDPEELPELPEGGGGFADLVRQLGSRQLGSRHLDSSQLGSRQLGSRQLDSIQAGSRQGSSKQARSRRQLDPQGPPTPSAAAPERGSAEE